MTNFPLRICDFEILHVFFSIFASKFTFSSKNYSFQIYIFVCLVVPWQLGSQLPDQGSNLPLLHWDHRVLTSGPPGSPHIQVFFFFSSTSLLLPIHLLLPSSHMCAQSCNPVDCGLPGSSVHGLFQARILEWVGVFFSMFRSF